MIYLCEVFGIPKEEPIIDENGVVNYFMLSLKDLDPFILVNKHTYVSYSQIGRPRSLESVGWNIKIYSWKEDNYRFAEEWR